MVKYENNHADQIKVITVFATFVNLLFGVKYEERAFNNLGGSFVAQAVNKICACYEI